MTETRHPHLDLVIIDMGRPGPALLPKYGTFSSWFLRAFAATGRGVDPDAFDAWSVDERDMLESDGIVLTGAEESVNDQLPWREEFDGKLRRAIDLGIPVLGVCFGHQYLGRFLGGRVERIEGGQEFGHYEIRLTTGGEKDPLFTDVQNPAWFLESHYEQIVEPPPGAAMLARSDDTPVQSFRWEDHVRGVQFHPEMTAGMVMTVIDELTELDEVQRERMKFEAQNPHDGLHVLANFVDICLRQREGAQ